jgi:hypothetical protein
MGAPNPISVLDIAEPDPLFDNCRVTITDSYIKLETPVSTVRLYPDKIETIIRLWNVHKESV